MITELPLVVVNVQRAGPSTGMPTKVEQADLYQSIYGRNGEAPIPVIACSTPADAFECTVEACRIAVQYMTPVILLSDNYIANGSEPWKLPDLDQLQPIPVKRPEIGDAPFLPYKRDEKNSRPWAVPGQPGLEHRIGGLEKEHETGNVSTDPDNHQFMVDLRQEKIMASVRPSRRRASRHRRRVLVVGWARLTAPSAARWRS